MRIGTHLLIIVCLIESPSAADQGANVSTQATDGVGSFLGGPCEDKCSDDLLHSVCSKTSKKCECDKSHPIALDNFTCIEAIVVGEPCNHAESCSYSDPNSFCEAVSEFYYKCACKKDYKLKEAKNGEKSKCIPANSEEPTPPVEVPTALGVGLGMGLFAGLTCLVLRLFSNARFGQPRGHYADANLPPPIMLTGMNTPSSAPPSRRSSGRSSGTAGSRRPSYTMLAPPSRPGSRRASSSSIRSQMSVRSYNVRPTERNYHEPLRPTLSAPTPEIGSPLRPSSRNEQKIPIYAEILQEEKKLSDDVCPSQCVQLEDLSPECEQRAEKACGTED